MAREENKEINILIANLQERLEKILSDPLSEETRKSRKALLIFCAIAIAIAEAKIIPKEINAFGLRSEALDQNGILVVGVLVLTYLLFSFVIYSISDVLRATVNYRAYRGDFKTLKSDANKWFRDILTRRALSWNITVFVRLFWDFIVPLAVYFYSVCLVSNGLVTIPINANR